MLFKSPVYSEARGSIGGITYSRNSTGLYTRARTVPVNPNTGLQQAVRNILSQLATAWRALTQANRDAWDAYAAATPITNKLGDSMTLTGAQWFTKANAPRLQAGLAQVSAGPILFGELSLTLPSIEAAEGSTDLSVTFTNTDSWATAVGGALLIWLSEPRPPTVNFYNGPYRYFGKVAGAVVPPTSPATVAGSFSIIGQEDDVIFARVQAVGVDGRVSPIIRMRSIIAGP